MNCLVMELSAQSLLTKLQWCQSTRKTLQVSQVTCCCFNTPWKTQAIQSTVRSTLNSPIMHLNLALKSTLCYKITYMSWLEYFSSIQRNGAKATWFIFRGRKVHLYFCHVLPECVISYVKNWAFLLISELWRLKKLD